MSLLTASIQEQVRKALGDMPAPVKLILFTQGSEGLLECENCVEARQLAEEVAALSDHLSIEVHDFVAEEELARQYGIDKIPALILARGGPQPKDYGLRLYGLPAGYEFATLIQGITMVSRGETSLSAQTRQELARLKAPVHIQVYVTPT